MANLLDVLPEYVLHWMVQRGTERQLEEKEVLLQEGERNESFYIVLDGLFEVVISSTSERRLGHYAAGSVLGELSLFAEGVTTATIIAREPSLVLEIPHRLLKEKLAHDHVYAADFYKALLTAVSHKLRQTTLKLYAAEGAATPEAMRDPHVRGTVDVIDDVKRIMVQLDKEGIKQGTVSEESYQKFFARAMEMMQQCHSALGHGSPLSDVIKQQIGARLQHEMLPYVLTTETADRFYSKPRGYAGDYLAIHKIYQNQPGGTGRLGPVVDRMFLNTPPSRAVRNRRVLLAGEILHTVHTRPSNPVRVMCMASGPASEVFDAFASLEDRTRLKVTLLDIDLQALAFVDDIRGRQKLANQITLVNENLIALYLGRGKVKVEQQDMIYSIGLVDYLNDKLVGKLLQYAFENLLPGGRVVLGNFHPRNPAKEFMDYVLEWSLMHLSE